MNLTRVLFRTSVAPALVVLAFVFSLGAAQAQTAAGAVVGASGPTSVQRGGGQAPLTIGAPVYAGDTVQVGAGGKLKLRMSDGTILALAPSSSLRIDTYLVDAAGRRQGAALSMGQGLLRSVTAPGAGPASFEVDTAAGSAAVRSTDWFVDAVPGSEQVSVLSGSVALRSRATGRAVTIPPGMASRLYAGRDPEPPRPVSRAEFGSLIARTEGGGGAPAPAPRPPAYYPPRPPVYYPPPAPGLPGGVIVVPGGGRGTPSGGQPGRGEPAPR